MESSHDLPRLSDRLKTVHHLPTQHRNLLDGNAQRGNLALSGAGFAALVDVDGGVHLPGRRDPQVQHRLRLFGDVAAFQGDDAVETQNLVEVPERFGDVAWTAS